MANITKGKAEAYAAHIRLVWCENGSGVKSVSYTSLCKWKTAKWRTRRAPIVVLHWPSQNMSTVCSLLTDPLSDQPRDDGCTLVT